MKKTMMMKNRKRQVAGTHYSRLRIEPVDLMVIFKMDWFQGEILKYSSRYNHKNGLEDLKKAISVCQLAIDRGLASEDLYAELDLRENRKVLEEYINQFNCTQLWYLVPSIIKRNYYYSIELLEEMIHDYEEEKA